MAAHRELRGRRSGRTAERAHDRTQWLSGGMQRRLALGWHVPIGILAAIIGYKIFDKCTPGDLSKEIIENKNVAAAIVAAAVILGVCIIIAASMMG